MGRGQCGETVHAHTNVIDTLEVTCTNGNRNRVHRLSAYPPNHKTIRSRLYEGKLFEGEISNCGQLYGRLQFAGLQKSLN